MDSQGIAVQSQRALRMTGYAGFIMIGWASVLIPSLIRSIEHDFHQSDAAFGLFYFISSLFYAAGSFGGGLLTERVGRRIVLSAAALLIAIGLGGEGIAQSWTLLLVAAPIANTGMGGIDGGTNALFLDLFREARGGAMNLLHLFFSVGAFLAPFVIGQLVAAGLNWRLLMVVSGIAALGLAVRLFALGMPSGRHVASRDSTHSDVITRAERSLLPFTALAIGICIYVAEEVSVSNWVVKFLSSVPEATATIVLSVYWGGLSLGRLLSSRLAERVDYTAFTVTCIVLTSTTLILAVLVPIFPLSATLFGLAGLFSGPIYPMIMAIGGNIYPHRLARLGGSLGASAVVGTLIYPPLIGLAASRYGLGTGLVGAGLLGFLGALAVALAVGAARRMRESGVGSAAGVGE